MQVYVLGVPRRQFNPVQFVNSEEQPVSVEEFTLSCSWLSTVLRLGGASLGPYLIFVFSAFYIFRRYW